MGQENTSFLKRTSPLTPITPKEGSDECHKG